MHQSYCWKKCEKNANSLIFVPTLSIIVLHKMKHLKFGYFLLLYIVKEDHVCQSTYSISIDIQYLDRHTRCVCQMRYCRSIEIRMSIEILYVDWLVCLTVLINGDHSSCHSWLITPLTIINQHTSFCWQFFWPLFISLLTMVVKPSNYGWPAFYTWLAILLTNYDWPCSLLTMLLTMIIILTMIFNPSDNGRLSS